jgi:hypothetical protein
MKIVLDIPKDFEKHFNEDKFKDSLLRLKADTNYGLEHESTISGNYEIELLDMLVEAFEKAKIVEDNKSVSNPYPSFFAEDYVDNSFSRW